MDDNSTPKPLSPRNEERLIRMVKRVQALALYANSEDTLRAVNELCDELEKHLQKRNA